MLWSLLVLGLVIGSNNLAVALALGAHGQIARRSRITAVFGVFEFVVPLVGIWLGAAMAQRIGTIAETLGVALIIALGVWTVASGLRGGEHFKGLASRVTSWRGLVLLAAGLSTDNLLVGFSLGLGKANPLLIATTIAVFAVVFTLVGITLGAKSKRHWEPRAKVGSGVLLIGLGVATALSWM